MKATDIIRDIMEKKEVKPSMLADRLKIKNNTLSERMTQKNLSVLKLSEMLRAMDYKIIVVPRNARVPEEGYELTIENQTKPKVDLDALLSDDEEVTPPKKTGRIKLTK